MIPQIDHVTQMSRAARAKLRLILASRLPIRTKLAIYKCYIRSRLTYAAPAWYALCSKLQCQRLHPAEYSTPYNCGGRVVRQKLRIARDLRVETIEEFVRMLARRTLNRADAGPYPSLHNLAPLYDRRRKDTSSHGTWYPNHLTRGRCELTHTGRLAKVTLRKTQESSVPLEKKPGSEF
ncbi:hypothetical protein EVAR_45007_1 [Eumeta japonica]|uniref:Uncharacterized protein n=1 Tax=Eumeta variegata TaxID=151549 RepID=A0A4C1XFS6_EUMVA|nr:hypothetical protein EVAR_45007_1 [Eumeta japonica]